MRDALQGPGAVHAKIARVREILGGFGGSIVAFSGGVDSTLLAVIAREVLGGEHVLAVTADSPSMARADLEDARQLAERLDLVHLVVRTGEVDDPAYRENTARRCFFCKHELFQALDELARERHIPVVVYGAIGDDRAAERPGQEAASRHRVRAPLQEVGLTKPEVRELARQLELPNWARPQNACLSSRIPHGVEVTRAKLRQIEEAEAWIRSQGFRQVRVRHHGTLARIEVGAEQLSRLADPALRGRIEAGVGACGFDEVVFDPLGYRSTGADAERSGGGGSARSAHGSILAV